MQIFAAYFDYFNGERQGFGQWVLPANYQGLGNSEKNARPIPGAEPWRRNIWVGAPGDYPFIGPYTSLDREVMRWHVRCAKAAGINGFFLYVLEWEERKRARHPQIRQLLDIAAQEKDFFIGFVDHYTSYGTVIAEPTRFLRKKRRSTQPLPDLPPDIEKPILSFKTEGSLQFLKSLKKSSTRRATTRSSQNNIAKSITLGKDRIAEMLNQHKSHPAYLRINGKPVICIPFIDEDISPAQFNDLIQGIKAKMNPPEDLYVVAITIYVYNFVDLGALSNTLLNLKPLRPWAEIGVDCFTSWTPNGMVEAPSATKLTTYKNYVADAKKFRKDTMCPMMPGFNDDDWRPGPAPSRTLNRANGENWRQQIKAAVQANTDFIYIQAWNEWHEGSQIEPSTNYKNTQNGIDPYLYLRIMAEELGKTWEIPSLPPPSSIDSLRRQEVGKTPVEPKPTPKPQPQPQPRPAKIFEFLAAIDFQHQIGRAESDGWSAAVSQDSPKKFLCFGPYTTTIPQGNRQALFTLMVDNNTADNKTVISLDVWDATTNKLLGKKDVRRKDFRAPSQYQDFEINFQNAEGHQLEFRTFWHGGAYVKQSKVRIS
jgi:hypothetical protein